jgi:hypothetical protein
MPKLLRPRPPLTTAEERRVRKLARTRHTPQGLDPPGTDDRVELGPAS